MMQKLPLTFMEKCVFDIKQARGNARSYLMCILTSAFDTANFKSFENLCRLHAEVTLQN